MYYGTGLLIVFLLLLYLFRSYFFKTPPEETTENELKMIHVFPDYPRNQPYESVDGNRLQFIVKGYSDDLEMREVILATEDILWYHSAGLGKFEENKDISGKYSGTIIHYITPQVEETKLVYIAVRYKGFTDATWIKIIKK